MYLCSEIWKINKQNKMNKYINEIQHSQTLFTYENNDGRPESLWHRKSQDFLPWLKWKKKKEKS